jgi:hypothetical protein
MYEYFVWKFRPVYSPQQELSLEKAMIPWRGCLKFRTNNPRKITKCGVLVRMVCEAVLDYICNMEIYSGKRRKLKDTVLSLLDRNVRVCSTMRANKGITCDLEGEGKCLKKEQSAFRRKSDKMVQVWRTKDLCERKV